MSRRTLALFSRTIDRRNAAQSHFRSRFTRMYNTLGKRKLTSVCRNLMFTDPSLRFLFPTQVLKYALLYESMPRRRKVLFRAQRMQNRKWSQVKNWGLWVYRRKSMGHMWFPKWPLRLTMARKATQRRDVLFDRGKALITRSSHDIISVDLW